MQKITSVAELRSVIVLLEHKQSNEWPLLKEQFLSTCEELKPLNIIKSSFKDITSSPDFKNDLLGAAVGLTTGYLSKKIIVGSSGNPLKVLLGNIIQLGISSIVSKNPETIKSLVNSLAGFFTKKNGTKEESVY